MSGEERDELAGARTDLAEDRTLLANERTFAGWARTAFAAIGIGLGLNALFATLQPAWVAKAISTAFLCIAVFVIIVAERRARAVADRLNSHRVETFKPINLRVMTVVIIVADTALIASIWLLI